MSHYHTFEQWWSPYGGERVAVESDGYYYWQCACGEYGYEVPETA